MRHVTEVEVLHGTTRTTKIIHKIDIVLHLEKDLDMTKILLLLKTLDIDMIIINETRLKILPFSLQIFLKISIQTQLSS